MVFSTFSVSATLQRGRAARARNVENNLRQCDSFNGAAPARRGMTALTYSEFCFNGAAPARARNVTIECEVRAWYWLQRGRARAGAECYHGAKV